MAIYKIFISLNKSETAKILFEVNNSETARIEFLAHDSLISSNSVANINIPPGNGKIFVHGELSSVGKMKSIQTEFSTVDLAPLTSPLHSSHLGMTERIRGLFMNLEKLSKDSDGDFFNNIQISKSGWTTSDISEIESKFSFSCPASAKELLLSTSLEIGDSSFALNPREFTTVSQKFQLFGYDSNAFSGKIKRANATIDVENLFSRSVVFFNEVGDGAGMLAYDPVDLIWFWMHEEFQAPKFLMDEQGNPWTSEDALCSVFHKLALDEIHDYFLFPYPAEGKEITFFDSSNPKGKFWLWFNSEIGSARINLLNHDHSFFLL